MSVFLLYAYVCVCVCVCVYFCMCVRASQYGIARFFVCVCTVKRENKRLVLLAKAIFGLSSHQRVSRPSVSQRPAPARGMHGFPREIARW